MPLLQAELLDRLKGALPPGTTDYGQLVLLNDARSSYAFTASDVDAGTGTLTIAGHTFSDAGNGTRVRFPSAAPGGLTLNLDYWVRNVVADGFQISTTPGGSPIASFDSAGSGTMTVSDQALAASDQVAATPDSNNAQWLRKEFGAPRISVSTPVESSYTLVVVSEVVRAKVSLTALIDNTDGVASLTATKILLLTGGSLTPGDLAGTPKRWFEVTISVAAGSATSYRLTAFESN